MSNPRRLATITAAVVAAVLATLALASTPAYAADAVEVNIGGVSGSAPGGRTFLQVSFTNRSNNSLSNVHSVITIHLDGMPSDGVVVQKTLGSQLGGSPAGEGTVRFTDPAAFDLPKNNRRQLSYLVQFTSSAPSGKASITVEAYQGGTRLGGDSVSTTLRGGAVNPERTSSTKTTPPNTNPGIVPTFEAGPSYSLAPLPQANELINADVPWSLYLLGGLLVALGGVILFLLFRRQRGPKPAQQYGPTEHATEEFDQARPPSLGYPTVSPVMRPTAVLPSVRDAEPPERPSRRR
jgi:hypothetical protein